MSGESKFFQVPTPPPLPPQPQGGVLINTGVGSITEIVSDSQSYPTAVSDASNDPRRVLSMGSNLLITNSRNRSRGERKESADEESLRPSEQVTLIGRLPPLFNKLGRFVDLDKLALIAASLMCFSILLVALSAVCLCCSSSAAAAEQLQHQHQSQLVVGTSQSRTKDLSAMLLQSGDDNSDSSKLGEPSAIVDGVERGAIKSVSMRLSSASLFNFGELQKLSCSASTRRQNLRPCDEGVIGEVEHLEQARRYRQLQAARDEYLATSGAVQRHQKSSSAPKHKLDDDTNNSTCDSDKTNSPTANENNRYNISAAHRAFLSSQGKSCGGTEASNSLLQTVGQQHLQAQQEAAPGDFTNYSHAASSSSSSDNCDSRALLHPTKARGYCGKLVNQRSSFASPSEANAQVDQLTVRNSQYPGSAILSPYTFQAAVSKARRDQTGGDACDYLSTDLLPISAEDQWPEPYVEPNDGEPLPPPPHDMNGEDDDDDEADEDDEQLDDNQNVRSEAEDRCNCFYSNTGNRQRRRLGKMSARRETGGRRAQRNAGLAYLDNWHTMAAARRTSTTSCTHAKRAAVAAAEWHHARRNFAGSLVRPHAIRANSFLARPAGAVNWLRWTPESSAQFQDRRH